MAKRSAGKAEFHGVREMQKLMKDLPGKMQKRVFKVALDRGLRVVRKKARQNAKGVKDTGALAKSIHIKSKVYPSGVAYGAVGPDRSKTFPAPPHRRWRNKAGKLMEYIRPSQYAHLVEDGTASSAAKPFLRPALEQSKGAAMGEMADGISVGLDREVKKLVKKRTK